MAHTNVDARYEIARYWERMLEVEKLKLEVTHRRRAFDSVHRELQNIPDAIEKYGYVDIESDTARMKLVAHKEPGT